MLEKRQSFTFVWGFTLGDQVRLLPFSSPLFSAQFPNLVIQVTLQSCTSASVFVDRDPENTSPQGPVAPYTIIAYPDQGTPTVDLLGNGPDNMSWTPRFPPGAYSWLTGRQPPSPLLPVSSARSTPKIAP